MTIALPDRVDDLVSFQTLETNTIQEGIALLSVDNKFSGWIRHSRLSQMRGFLTGNLKGRIITARLKYWAKAGGLCQEGIMGIVNDSRRRFDGGAVSRC